MQTITKLEVQKKDESRVNLYLDEKFYAGISIELVIKYGLKKGMEIDIDKLNELIVDDEKDKAISKAVKYMSSTLKTEKQIRDYLKKKEYSDTTINYVIDKMIEYKYLDDFAYCKAFIVTNSHKYGKTRLVYMLKSKGVKDSIIDEVFNGEVVVDNSIEKVADKYLKGKPSTDETYIKLSRFLFARGYDFDDINRLVREKKNK